jgi:phosphonopyruvate decarboxylase
MQNSGLGNAVNPLTSLADKKVYSIPMLLLIGWRGEPAKTDEPQHVKQGEITPQLLDLLDIPYQVLSASMTSVYEIVANGVDYLSKHSSPYALVARRDTFLPHESLSEPESAYHLIREEVIRALVEQLSEDAVVVSTTGRASRELFEVREVLGQTHERDFLTIGSMGHCSQIALGIALQKPDRQVYCFDGDGSLIMHMGSLASIGVRSLGNFRHVVFNNGVHESVGGQPSDGFDVDFCTIAEACGYQHVVRVDDDKTLREKIAWMRTIEGPVLVEIRLRSSPRDSLGRPTTSLIENKERFMECLQQH